MRKTYWSIGIIVVLFAFCAWVTIHSVSNGVLSLFDRFSTPKPTLVAYAQPNDLPQDWFAVPATQGVSTFLPVFLPFTTSSQGVPDDPSLRLTFPSLLYYKFSFVPDNTSERTAMFIFRKYPNTSKLTEADSEKIQQYLQDWHATHAISGSVVVTPRGYTGALRVVNAQGVVVFRKRYPQPLPCFTLMGRMVEDWMAYRQQQCAPAVRTELERPMTTRLDTLRWYGGIFKLPLSSPQEWGIYRQILQADPNFAEVRYTLAAQHGWDDKMSAIADTETAQALASHPVILAMEQFNESYVMDLALLLRARRAIAHCRQILPDHPVLAAAQVYAEVDTMRPFPAIAKYLPLARKHPTSWVIQDALATYYLTHKQVAFSTPLSLSAAQSGAHLGMGGLGASYYQAALGYWQAGQGRAALYCLHQGLRDPYDEANQRELQEALVALYRDFLDARTCVNVGEACYRRETNAKIQQTVCLAAYEAGVRHWIPDPQETFAKKRFVNEQRDFPTTLVGRRRALAEKRLEQLRALSAAEASDPEALALYAEVYQQKRWRNATSLALQAWQTAPRIPRLGKLLQTILVPQGRAQDVARYAAVMAWAAPEIPYWTTLRQEALKAGAVEDSDAEITRLLAAWTAKSRATPPAPEPPRMVRYAMITEGQPRPLGLPQPTQGVVPAPWAPAPPFLIEYLVMRAVSTPQNAQRLEDAFTLYLQYGRAMTALHSDGYNAHLLIFAAQIGHQLPAARQARWRNACDATLRTHTEPEVITIEMAAPPPIDTGTP
ncbi:MAG TPA: hypothetical protein VGL77_01120 [Armatimonadota bacterium]|jgi:hypothetical protein